MACRNLLLRVLSAVVALPLVALLSSGASRWASARWCLVIAALALPEYTAHDPGAAPRRLRAAV